jgi:hypothetical protein
MAGVEQLLTRSKEMQFPGLAPLGMRDTSWT